MGHFFGSSLEDRLRYAPSDCFETFPFPPNFENRSQLEASGQSYYEFLRRPDGRNDEGLTKTYNRFHDPDERSPDILKLRELHAAMDKAVLEAYGWHDLAESATCEFLLDYEEDEEDEEVQRPPTSQEALALPLARRPPRRGTRPPARTQSPAPKRNA